jgi:2-polyprenyl-3-methyl-5-hydroxy-6-metoxy-1,4-benzoquinol methylase
MDNKLEEMLQINEKQHEYYEKASGSAESPLNSQATNFWRRFRRNAFSVFRNAEIQNSVVGLHRQWIGDVSKAKVLDLGLGEGNPLSLELAKEAREYVAIDLSSARMDIFRKKLSEAGITGAKTYVEDFLSSDFPECDFDVVYAMAIFHHFRHIEAFMDALSHRMRPGGVVVTLDPIQTWIPVKLVRMAYRPFQTDAAWEFPFTKSSIDAIQRKFRIERVQGVYGHSKWAMPLSAFNPEAAKQYAIRWHMKDLQHATELSKIRSCLRVSFLLRKEESPR